MEARAIERRFQAGLRREPIQVPANVPQQHFGQIVGEPVAHHDALHHANREDLAETVPVIGSPDPKRVCTSDIERQNLTMRMQMRRLTRLTNGFSKKWENLWAALCLHFAWYNFCRVQRTLRVTPAMESGIADRIWTLRELIA
jgi:hypothetical protein